MLSGLEIGSRKSNDSAVVLYQGHLPPESAYGRFSGWSLDNKTAVPEIAFRF